MSPRKVNPKMQRKNLPMMLHGNMHRQCVAEIKSGGMMTGRKRFGGHFTGANIYFNWIYQVYYLPFLDACWGSGWHRVALKLGCVGLILLLMGLSVLVGFLVQKPPIEKCSVAVQENKTEPTVRSTILECPRDWHLHWNKCLFISQTSRPWAEGLADCSLRGATLLLIGDGKELKLLQDFSKGKGQQFFIGLKYVQEDKVWKWMNGSILNTNL
ncbi:rCG30291, partial [Rattus norvegicus]